MRSSRIQKYHRTRIGKKSKNTDYLRVCETRLTFPRFPASLAYSSRTSCSSGLRLSSPSISAAPGLSCVDIAFSATEQKLSYLLSPPAHCMMRQRLMFCRGCSVMRETAMLYGWQRWKINCLGRVWWRSGEWKRQDKMRNHRHVNTCGQQWKAAVTRPTSWTNLTSNKS